MEQNAIIKAQDDQSSAMQTSRPMMLVAEPKEILESGRKAAVELMRLVKMNNWTTRIGKKDHLSFEAWQAVAKFYGYTVRTTSTKYVEYGSAKGFEATAEVIDRNGAVVGSADGMCMLGESSQWTGKPLYAIRSMAQTRACSRALRQILAWVIVLAGYAPAPTEDAIDDVKDVDGEPTAQMRKWLSGLIQSGKVALPAGKYCNINETNLTYDEAKAELKKYKEETLNKKVKSVQQNAGSNSNNKG